MIKIFHSSSGQSITQIFYTFYRKKEARRSGNRWKKGYICDDKYKFIDIDQVYKPFEFLWSYKEWQES